MASIAKLIFPGATIDRTNLGDDRARELDWIIWGAVLELDEAATALHIFSSPARIAADLPAAYASRVQFVGAKAFVNALDMVANILDVLSKEVGAPAGVAAAHAALRSGIPDLGELRDGLAHNDERMRRKAFKKTIQPKPNQNDLALGNLDGDTLSTMGRTGHQVRVAINEATLLVARDAVQAAIDALPWEIGGRPIEWPRL